jgi:hypothetical protein
LYIPFITKTIIRTINKDFLELSLEYAQNNVSNTDLKELFKYCYGVDVSFNKSGEITLNNLINISPYKFSKFKILKSYPILSKNFKKEQKESQLKIKNFLINKNIE